LSDVQDHKKTFINTFILKGDQVINSTRPAQVGPFIGEISDPVVKCLHNTERRTPAIHLPGDPPGSRKMMEQKIKGMSPAIAGEVCKEESTAEPIKITSRMPIPQPPELQVIREDLDYVIINDGINNRLALRKPLRDGRWNERRDPNGRLISLQLKIKGVN
jgi:hypothetical protein